MGPTTVQSACCSSGTRTHKHAPEENKTRSCSITDSDGKNDDIIVPNNSLAVGDCEDHDENHPTSLPASVAERISCLKITELNLSQQGLTLFPDTDDIVSLSILDISHNNLKELPPKLKSATHLRVLNASHNKISVFPNVLVEGLPVLITINLSCNAFQTCPRPACFQHLKDLNVRSCQLKCFPKWIIFQALCLETLDLSQNSIFEFNSVNEQKPIASSCWALKKINLSNTSFSEWSISLLENFPVLEHLDVSNYGPKYYNRLMECHQLLFPPSLKVLKAVDIGIGSGPSLKGKTLKLETLNLAKNLLNWINDDFPNESLRVLVLSQCFICTLPNNIGDMVNLEYLNLSHNDISSLPPCFSSLTRLKHLDLYSNSLDCFPDVLESLVKLTSLDVCCNLFEPPTHPLGSDLLSYKELRSALRATLSVDRGCGMVRTQVENVYSDELHNYHSPSGYNSDCDDTDNEVPPNHAIIESFGPSTQEDDWDDPESNVVYHTGFSNHGLNHKEVLPLFDSNEFFMKLLHLVPARIRNSPLFFHRIDTSKLVTSNPNNAMDNIVEGQFDD